MFYRDPFLFLVPIYTYPHSIHRQPVAKKLLYRGHGLTVKIPSFAARYSPAHEFVLHSAWCLLDLAYQVECASYTTSALVTQQITDPAFRLLFLTFAFPFHNILELPLPIYPPSSAYSSARSSTIVGRALHSHSVRSFRGLYNLESPQGYVFVRCLVQYDDIDPIQLDHTPASKAQAEACHTPNFRRAVSSLLGLTESTLIGFFHTTHCDPLTGRRFMYMDLPGSCALYNKQPSNLRGLFLARGWTWNMKAAVMVDDAICANSWVFPVEERFNRPSQSVAACADRFGTTLCLAGLNFGKPPVSTSPAGGNAKDDLLTRKARKAPLAQYF
ncbi:hypothetical protein BDP27DRAFT_1360890 [Rhodocollybia butyracea]|uniref:Uncharacterized protein n=1 Tax=Rhodocollybia butyracea TaxID=206335 RepID=A0A9P5Q1Y5_9AGAR|nr:hypothetical protein BDP27DRAFT_1360890 [Rhodocollybia butyracea]